MHVCKCVCLIGICFLLVATKCDDGTSSIRSTFVRRNESKPIISEFNPDGDAAVHIEDRDGLLIRRWVRNCRGVWNC